MKNLQIISTRTMTGIFIIGTLFIMSSCNGQGKSQDAQKKEASNLQVRVEAPAMDLHAATFMGDLKAVQQHINAGTVMQRRPLQWPILLL